MFTFEVLMFVLVLSVLGAQIYSTLTRNHLSALVSTVSVVFVSATLYVIGGVTFGSLAVIIVSQIIVALISVIRLIKEEFYYE